MQAEPDGVIPLVLQSARATGDGGRTYCSSSPSLLLGLYGQVVVGLDLRGLFQHEQLCDSVNVFIYFYFTVRNR